MEQYPCSFQHNLRLFPLVLSLLPWSEDRENVAKLTFLQLVGWEHLSMLTQCCINAVFDCNYGLRVHRKF